MPKPKPTIKTSIEEVDAELNRVRALKTRSNALIHECDRWLDVRLALMKDREKYGD